MSVSAQQKIRAHHPIFDQIIKRCHRTKPVPAAVVWPLSGVALRGADEAARTGIIEPHLIGRAEDIRRLAREQNIDISAYKVENAEDYAEAARLGVELCRTRICDVLMKGSLRTDQFLQPVMSQGDGLRTGRRISHVFVLDAVDYSRPLLVTDGVVNIYPDLDDKVDIVQNAIELAHALGIRLPRVAILAAVETVNPKIVSTLHAAALCKMADRAQITGGLLDGPLGFDDAINPESAAIKRIRSEVAGKADILVVPDLDSGNMLAKSIEQIGLAHMAGVVLGARVPMILTSRSDEPKARLASAAVARMLAHDNLDHGVNEPVP